MVGCGMKCCKYLLFLFNIIFWLSGLAVCGVGIWIVVDSSSFFMVMDNVLLIYGAYILIGVGGVVIVVGFCGCCGAIMENKCLLGFYFMFLLIIFLAELAAGIMASLYSSETETFVKDAMNSTLSDDYGFSTVITSAWDSLQGVYQCCGVEDYMDYKNTKWYNTTNIRGENEVPLSCCIITNAKEGTVVDGPECQAGNTQYINTEGCFDKTNEWFRQNILIIGGVGIGIAMIQLFGMIASICLCRNIGQEDD